MLFECYHCGESFHERFIVRDKEGNYWCRKHFEENKMWKDMETLHLKDD